MTTTRTATATAIAGGGKPKRKSSARASLISRSVAALIMAVLAFASCHQSIRCQFLQPQSHLSRLVQSIASPLVLASSLNGGGGDDSTDSYNSEPGVQAQARPEEQAQNQHYQASQYQPEAGQHYQHYQRQQQQQQQQPEYGRQLVRDSQRYLANAQMQQAPSQQRGIPERYYGGPQDDEDAGAPSNHHRQQPAANEQYQMGAYLGPTIDDKEIQGAFNSNDDRDDDDTPGYDSPPGAGRDRPSAANVYAASQQDSASGYPMGDQSGYGPAASGYPTGGRGAQASAVDNGSAASRAGSQRATTSYDDDAGADEDDEPAPARSRQPRFRQSSSMSQAASQYHQHRNQAQPGALSQMMAAANGYSPMGSGPFDLSSLMAAAAGGAGNGQGYEVYNGDGSYPGYYPQQQQQQQGRRAPAASMNNPYGYQNQMGADGGYQNQNQGQVGNANQQRGRGGDSDDADADNDADED